MRAPARRRAPIPSRSRASDAPLLRGNFAGFALDRPLVMAIVNVTPDSFSDGGERLDPARAIDDGLRFVAEGADILDVGGESTRPGSQPISPEEELRRILPVVEGLVRQKATISIDTRRASVARAALDVGARIVNDVSALRDDPAMLPLTADRGCEVVLMHRRGLSENSFAGPAYGNVVEDVRSFLVEHAATCEAAGVVRQRIALDPGIGFGKSVGQELELISGAGRIAEAGYPVLIGCSRKSFIGKLTGVEKPADRDTASAMLAVEAIRRGAAIVRVHNVVATRQALAISAAMR